MTQKERMLSGKLYHAGKDESLAAEYRRGQKLMAELNRLPFDAPERPNLIKNLFGRVGKNAVITGPVYCDYGSNVSFGDGFYCNYDCIFLDVCPIEFGDNVFVGPRCSFYTAGHPIDKDVRNTRLESGQPIKVGNDCWFGGSVTVVPGVTIGDDVVIGAGSVVCKDLPSHTVCAGNPCRVIRSIGPEDREKWQREQADWEANFGPADSDL